MKRLSEMTTLIVGLGQIGGSIGIDLVAGQIVARVIGFDSHKAVMTTALQRKAIDRAVASLRAGVAEADLVILATPIDATLRLLPSILELMPADSLCLDVASTKQAILQMVEKLKPRAGYISTHPIAGTEGIGIDSAISGLLQGKVLTITPASSAKPAQIRLVKQLATALGGKPMLIGSKRHDRLLAHTSHLPYAIATALVQVAGETGESDKLLRRLAGGSFASATRVANSSPELTQNLLLSNRAEVSKAIAKMESELSSLRKILQRNDADGLQQYVKAAHKQAKKGKK